MMKHVTFCMLVCLGVTLVAATAPTADLSSGIWRHDPATANTGAHRALVATASQVGVLGAGNGLNTAGAAHAHYATLSKSNTWAISSQYCKDHGGALCTKAQICSDKPIGASELPKTVIPFSPVRDSENGWVQLVAGEDRSACDLVNAPSWGTEARNSFKGTDKTKNLVACCDDDGVMKSSLIPDGALVDPSVKSKLKELKHLKRKIRSLEARVSTLEAANGASAGLMTEIRDALALRGSSALVAATQQAGMCCGRTVEGNSAWVQYGGNGLYIDMDIRKCGFKATPAIVSSITGNSGNWMLTGPSSIYSRSPTSFRIYVHYPAAVSPSVAKQYGWAINWCAKMPNGSA